MPQFKSTTRRILSESAYSVVARFEHLEGRRLLCGIAAAHAALAGDPAAARAMELVSQFDRDGDGHLTESQYQSLSTADQKLIDPHLVQADYDGPIDYDKLLGLPTSGGPEALSYPDFFPQLQGSAFIDQTEQPGRNLLRFGTQVNNQGTGPASLISGRPGIDPIPAGTPITSWVNPDGSQNVLQAVYNYTGSTYTLSHYLAAGRFTYHTGHDHFHYDGYANYKLRHNNGGVPGAYVLRTDGSGVVGAKTGFCLLTFGGTFTTEGGQDSSTLPGFNQDTHVPSTCGLQQGLRVGRYDIYSSGLEGQWIDVTGVPNGNYFLEMQMDGEGAVTETNEANNTKNFAVNINASTPGQGIPADRYESPVANNSFANAVNLGQIGRITESGLTIHYGQDYDYFRFTPTSNGTYTVTATASNNNTYDLGLYLYDSAGTQIRASTNQNAPESVSYPFATGQTYYVMIDGFNSSTVGNYSITWNINPLVDASAPTPTASVVTGPGIIRITRNGPTSSPLTINLTYGGTAVSNVDYNPLPSSVSIGNLESSVDIPVTIKPGATLSTNKTVIANISTNSLYAIGNGNATVTLLENTKPTVVNKTFQYADLPQSVRFTFSEAIQGLNLSDIQVQRVSNGQTVPVQSFAYDPGTLTATFTFNGELADDDYVATMAAGAVTDTNLNPNIAATFNFKYLFGDITGDGFIDFDDYVAIDNGFNSGLTGYANGDLNRDGVVDFDDYIILDDLFNG